MLAVFLTLFSLVLTAVVGGIFLLGLHHAVQWVVTTVESRSSVPTVADERELTAH